MRVAPGVYADPDRQEDERDAAGKRLGDAIIERVVQIEGSLYTRQHPQQVDQEQPPDRDFTASHSGSRGQGNAFLRKSTAQPSVTHLHLVGLTV